MGDICNELTLYIQSHTSLLESFPRTNDVSQLELPGISSDDGGHDLNESLRELDQQLDAALPKAQEQELLKRFRKSDEQNKQLIMQLMRM